LTGSGEGEIRQSMALLHTWSGPVGEVVVLRNAFMRISNMQAFKEPAFGEHDGSTHGWRLQKFSPGLRK
jgi:hypothetical protein